MDELQRDATRNSPAQDFLQSLVTQQRCATDELKACCKELASLLEDLLSAKPQLRTAYRELLGKQDPPETHRVSKVAPQPSTMAQWKREAERNLQKGSDLIRESGRIRQRSKAMRGALRGANPHPSKPVADGLDGWHARDGKDGSNHDGISKLDGLNHAGHSRDGHPSNGHSRDGHAPDGQALDGQIRDGHAKRDGFNHDGLSKREFQVLRLIVDGKSSKEIAVELGISFKTAVTHRASIMSKLTVHETASVVREAIRRGLV